jgi:hypothetical protein
MHLFLEYRLLEKSQRCQARQFRFHSPAKQRPFPNDDSALTILQICIPMTTTSTELQGSNNRHYSLNDVTAPQAFPATAATMTATTTRFLAIITAIAKATIKLVECFLHPTKTGANNATDKSESPLLYALFGSAITTERIHTPSLLLLYVHDDPAIMTALNAQNLLLCFFSKLSSRSILQVDC